MLRRCGMASRESRRWVLQGLIAVLFASLANMNASVQASALHHLSTASPSSSIVLSPTTSPTPTTSIQPPSSSPPPPIAIPVIPLPPASHKIRESVVISTAVDAEKEAQDLYDKALRQYGSYGASARNICATWELRGCQCTGSVEELTLSCRDVGLVEVPTELPVEIVKL